MVVYSKKIKINERKNTMNSVKTDHFTKSNTKSIIEKNDLIRKIQELFDDEVIKELQRTAKTTSRAVLLPHVMCASALEFVALQYDSFLKVFEHMQRGTWFSKPINVSHQAFYKRFRDVNVNCMEILFQKLNHKLQQSHHLEKNRSLLGLCPFASGIYALDQTTLDQVNRKHFLRDRGRKNPEKSGIPGKISALINLKTNLYEKIRFHDDFRENEKISAREMLEDLPEKSLLLADTGYYSFRWFDDLIKKGLYFISRIRDNTSVKVIHTYVDSRSYREKLVYLGGYNASKGAQPVRLVEFTSNGKWWRLITNVLEPKELSVMDMVDLYASRWDIETTFQTLKQTLDLNNLRLCDQVGVKWQLWATLIVYQLVQSLRMDVAQELEVEFPRISLHNVIKSIEAYERERAGRSEKLSLFDWMLKYFHSLSLLKRRNSGTNQKKKLPKKIEALSENIKPYEGTIETRTPRYDARNRERKHSGAIVGMERKKRKNKTNARKQKKNKKMSSVR